jgi:putative endonuclease
MKQYYVYILANKPYGTLYAGVTNNLVKRCYQHRNKMVPGFTSKYHASRLVWYEVYGDIAAAIQREKQIKKWKRDWKIELIERENPHWEDMYLKITGESRD